jgi:Na+/H+ antiporter NhaD/arsenite permease-like protein
MIHGFYDAHPVWAIPFVGMLLSLALMPLLVPSFWHRHYGKIAIFWSASLMVPIVTYMGKEIFHHTMVYSLVHHYLPFILMISCLYTISGGIRIEIQGRASLQDNLIFIWVASFMASVMGTTGAAMIFFRPFFMMNRDHPQKTMLVVLFIFSVCNVGGCLTALGDPPLFLGFLKGVPFFWTAEHLMIPFLIIMIGLSFVLAFISQNHKTSGISWRGNFFIEGKKHFFWLGLVIFVTLSTAFFAKISPSIIIAQVKFLWSDIIRDILLLIIMVGAYKTFPRNFYAKTPFPWDPLKEVLILFFGIFITATPVMMMLKGGVFNEINDFLNHGGPYPTRYFWTSGVLSGFLDNAPTYLVFFNIAGGNVQELLTTHSRILEGISAGSVFMGALTYIGNAPNFMVKSMAESYGIKMPSFFKYFLIACIILGPLLFLCSLMI